MVIINKAICIFFLILHIKKNYKKQKIITCYFVAIEFPETLLEEDIRT